MCGMRSGVERSCVYSLVELIYIVTSDYNL